MFFTFLKLSLTFNGEKTENIAETDIYMPQITQEIEQKSFDEFFSTKYQNEQNKMENLNNKTNSKDDFNNKTQIEITKNEEIKNNLKMNGKNLTENKKSPNFGTINLKQNITNENETEKLEIDKNETSITPKLTPIAPTLLIDTSPSQKTTNETIKSSTEPTKNIEFPQKTPEPTPYVCELPNMVYKDNKCQCKEGYLNNPKKGCFKCNRCDPNAVCVWPGKCECIKGFHGNGAFCSHNPPLLLSIHPKECLRDERCRVNVSVNYEGPQHETAFCQFGNIIVRADYVGENVISCIAPLFSSDSAVVQVSFDALEWSEETAELILRRNRFWYLEWLFPILGVVAVFIIMSFIVLAIKSSGKSVSDESIPLKYNQARFNDHLVAKYRNKL